MFLVRVHVRSRLLLTGKHLSKSHSKKNSSPNLGMLTFMGDLAFVFHGENSIFYCSCLYVDDTVLLGFVVPPVPVAMFPWFRFHCFYLCRFTSRIYTVDTFTHAGGTALGIIDDLIDASGPRLPPDPERLAGLVLRGLQRWSRGRQTSRGHLRTRPGTWPRAHGGGGHGNRGGKGSPPPLLLAVQSGRQLSVAAGSSQQW